MAKLPLPSDTMPPVLPETVVVPSPQLMVAVKSLTEAETFLHPGGES